MLSGGRTAAALIWQIMQRGEIRPAADLEAVLNELFAPVYFRLFFGHGPLDGSLATTLVTRLLGGLSAPR